MPKAFKYTNHSNNNMNKIKVFYTYSSDSSEDSFGILGELPERAFHATYTVDADQFNERLNAINTLKTALAQAESEMHKFLDSSKDDNSIFLDSDFDELG